MKKKGIKELVFPLRKFDGERPDLDAPNGEVEVEAGLIGRVQGVSAISLRMAGKALNRCQRFLLRVALSQRFGSGLSGCRSAQVLIRM